MITDISQNSNNAYIPEIHQTLWLFNLKKNLKNAESRMNEEKKYSKN